MNISETTPLSLSVIVPSYNQGRFLKAALDSIFIQEYPVLECIVIDAGSTDDTHSVLEAYKEQVTVVSAPHLTQSEVMNRGLELSRGDIVTFLNADDISSNHSYPIVSQYFRKRQDVDMVYGDFHIIDETGKRLLTHKEIAFHRPSYLFLGLFISYPTVFLRRRMCLKIGRFDPSLRFAMDQDYWLRVIRHGKVEHIPAVLASFRWHPNSKSVVYEKEARTEYRSVRKRYLGNRSGFMSCGFFWLLYKARRIFLKLIQGKYWASQPQPIVFYLWKRSLSVKRRKYENQNWLRTVFPKVSRAGNHFSEVTKEKSNHE